MNRIQMDFSEISDCGYAYDESIKTLRTNLQFCGNGIKTVMFTSSVPNEGKSSIVFSLATSIAQMGKKVLVIDADIRKSVWISRYQIKEKTCGLSQLLSGQKNIEEVVYGTNVENMDIILAGPYAPNPSELLEEDSFIKLLEWAKNQYDYVLVDTPPIANVIDAAIVAKLCDGAVIVMQSGVISYKIAQRVKQQLEKSGCRILGVVLNKIAFEKGSYYSRYAKYGNYGKYYGGEYYGREKND